MPSGEQVARDAINRGLGEWQFGSKVAALSIAAQEFAYDNMARMLARHGIGLRRPIPRANGSEPPRYRSAVARSLSADLDRLGSALRGGASR